MVSNYKEYSTKFQELKIIGKGNYGELTRESLSHLRQEHQGVSRGQENRSGKHEKRRGKTGSSGSQFTKDNQTPAHSQIPLFVFDGPVSYYHNGVLRGRRSPRTRQSVH